MFILRLKTVFTSNCIHYLKYVYPSIKVFFDIQLYISKTKTKKTSFDLSLGQEFLKRKYKVLVGMMK